VPAVCAVAFEDLPFHAAVAFGCVPAVFLLLEDVAGECRPVDVAFGGKFGLGGCEGGERPPGLVVVAGCVDSHEVVRRHPFGEERVLKHRDIALVARGRRVRQKSIDG
jgi:hypothetical protein